ncbi:ABC transporter ATP-binding protein [Oceanotoga sp. DSM 15011]|uniref:ABC-2 type transport system ATP-binding protein n=1 Tax=Oceanotoga teriensis TaxID=515440 RepID=A0AA45C5R4_9BACT|nr:MULTISPECIES: ABC transporter ATP-binding protein [Oceanotoga]PWJ89321.1 ABC-2 type transport system ATP-binding protein [Oceanotoga teriensis]UYO98821.1 ABC transporter ATP-binding protein [Oceanotoga sp. DSM 15011]
MIKIKNLEKTYNNNFKAVKNMNLEVKKGEIFGFLGPNGAGKTTTIKMITGIIQPSSGEIFVNGLNIKKDPLKIKQSIGYVSDEPLLMEKLKGIEYIKFICDMFEVPPLERENRLEKLLKHFKLGEAINNPISSYSHGMKQKLSLISTLIHNPDLWILDEPIVGLDPESAFILKKMMKNHTQNNKTVFFSTHIMEIAEKVCDRIAIINKGEIIFMGTIEQLKENKGNESLEDLFLEVTESESEKIDFSYLD